MRAEEIFEQTVDSDGSRLIKDLGDRWLWQVPASVYVDFLNNVDPETLYGPAQPLPQNHDLIFYLGEKKPYRAKENITPGDAAKDPWAVVGFYTNSGTTLVPLSVRWNMSAAELKLLAKLTKTTDAPDLSASQTNYNVLYQGKVEKTSKTLSYFATDPLDSGASVYKIPSDKLWVVGYGTYFKPYDIVYVIKHPLVGDIRLGVTNNKIDDVRGKTSARETISAIKELAQREGLGIDVDLPEPPPGKPKFVKPHSNMHKMLAFLADNPESTRSDWFVKHLGNDPQGMPGWTSDTSQDGRAARLGWIVNTGTPSAYRLSITPLGAFVLARLNSGQAVPYTL